MTRDEYLILTFVIIVAIILLSPDLMSAMLIISILVNMYVLSARTAKRPDSAASTPPAQATPATPAAPAEPPAPISPNAAYGLQQPSMYGSDWEAHQAYTDPGATGWKGRMGTVYSPHVDIPEGTTMGIDRATVEMARRRSRDKQAIEGAAVKDVNYFKYHFADDHELDEKRRWWGNAEF